MAVYTSAGWPTNADTQLTSALAGMVSGDELQFVSNHTFDHSIQQNLPAGCKITADIYGRVQTITNTDTTSDKWLEMGTNCVVERVDFNFPEGPDTTSPGSGLGSDFPDGRGISMNTDCELVAVKMTGGGVTYFVEGVGKSNVTIRNSFFEGAYIQVAMGNIDNFLYEQNIARNARRDAIKTTINAASLGWVRNSAIRNNLFMDMTDAGDFTGGFNNSIIEDNFTVNIGQDWDLKAIYEYSWQVDNPSLTPVLHDVTIRNNTSHQARSVAVITTIVRGPYTSIINNSNWRTYAPQNITFENQLMIHPPGSTKDKALVDSRYSTDITITNPTIREDTIVNRKVAEARSSILGYGFTEETLGEGPSFDVDRPDEGNFTREKGSFPNPTFASLEPSFGRSALGATTMPTYTAEGSAVLFADDTTFTLADVTYDGTTTTLTGGAGTVSLTEITGTDAVFANNVVTISQPDATNNPTVNGTTNVGMTGRLEQTVTIGGVDFPILSGNLAIDLDLIVNDVITAAGALADQSFTEATGVQTFDVSGDFTGTITGYSITPAVTGVTVSAAGVVSFDTDAMAVQTGTSIVVEASNATKSATSGFSLDILAAGASTVTAVTPVSDLVIDGAGLVLGTYEDGIPYVTGTGRSLTSRTLAATGSGATYRNGLTLNPQRGVNHTWDGRMDGFTETADPTTLVDGDVLVVAQSGAEGRVDREGYNDNYGAVYMAASAPAANTFGPALVAGENGNRIGPEVIDVDAYIAGLPSYSATGMDQVPLADILSAIDRIAAPMMMPINVAGDGIQTNNADGYESFGPNGFGSHDLSDGPYGEVSANAFSVAMEALLLDYLTAAEKRQLAVVLLHHGKQWYSVMTNSPAMSQQADGAHIQFYQGVCCMYADATGRDAAAFISTHPGNWDQVVPIDATLLSELQTTHTSTSLPCESYTRTVQSGSLMDMRFNVDAAVDPFRLHLWGQRAQRISDGAIVTIVDQRTPSEASTINRALTSGGVMDVTLAAGDTAFAVGDTFRLLPPVDYEHIDGGYLWATRGTSEPTQYHSAYDKNYHGLQRTGGQVAFCKAAGLSFPALDRMSDWVNWIGNNPGYQERTVNFIGFMDAFAGLSMSQDFFTNHAATIFGTVVDFFGDTVASTTYDFPGSTPDTGSGTATAITDGHRFTSLGGVGWLSYTFSLPAGDYTYSVDASWVSMGNNNKLRSDGAANLNNNDGTNATLDFSVDGSGTYTTATFTSDGTTPIHVGLRFINPTVGGTVDMTNQSINSV